MCVQNRGTQKRRTHQAPAVFMNEWKNVRVCVYVCQTLTIKRHYSAPQVKTSTIIFAITSSVRHTGHGPKIIPRRVRESKKRARGLFFFLWQRVTAILLILLAARPSVVLSRRIILANLFSLAGRSHERELLFFSHPLDAWLGFYLFVSRPAELVLKCVAVRAWEKEINQHHPAGCPRPLFFSQMLVNCLASDEVWRSRVKFNGNAIEVPQLLSLGFLH